MIDKIIYTFFGWLDTFSEHLDRVFFPKPKPKKKRKNVNLVIVIVIVQMTYTYTMINKTYALAKLVNVKGLYEV